jgi:glycosyltransferase involved in cell wall biosynthesis
MLIPKMNKEKLFYISNSTLPSKHANSIHVMKMCRAFSKQNLDVTLLAPDVPSARVSLGECFAFYGMLQRFNIVKLAYLKLLPGQLKIIVYSFFTLFYVLKHKPQNVYGRNIIGCSLASIFGYKTAIELHSPPSKFTRFEYCIFYLALKRRKNLNITVISDALKKICVDEGLIRPEQLYVHHDGADEIPDSGLPISLKGNNNTYKVGYIGHLYQGRGVDIILQLAKQNPECEFHIIGGSEEDVDNWVTKGISGNVYFYGHMSTHLAEQYRKQFDVLLAPYQKVVSIAGKGDTSGYMSPLKIFEYMATKKPIVCSDIPVLREVLNDKNSILVPCDNIDAWESAIRHLKESPDFSNKISNNAFNDFIDKFTWDKRAEHILLYIEV